MIDRKLTAHELAWADLKIGDQVVYIAANKQRIVCTVTGKEMKGYLNLMYPILPDDKKDFIMFKQVVRFWFKDGDSNCWTNVMTAKEERFARGVQLVFGMARLEVDGKFPIFEDKTGYRALCHSDEYLRGGKA